MKLGEWAEQKATEILIQNQFEILERNYHCRWGEIDIVAKKGTELIFIEVKARSPTQMGNAVEVISRSKQLKLYKSALHFLQNHEEFDALYCRFDAICFDLKKRFSNKLQYDFSDIAYQLDWIENAFTLNADLINL